MKKKKRCPDHAGHDNTAGKNRDSFFYKASSTGMT